MANRYAGTPLSSQWDAIQRRRAVNKALLEQAMTTPGGTQFVRGGRVGPTQAVPYSWGTAAGQLGEALISRMGEKKADEQEKALSDKYDVNRQRAVDAVVGQIQGTKTPYDMPPEQQMEEGEQIPGLSNAPREPDLVGGMIEGSTNPYLQTPGMENVISALTAPKPKGSYKEIPRSIGGGKWKNLPVTDGVPGDTLIGEAYERGPQASSTSVTVDTKDDVTKKGTEKYWGGVGTRADELQASAILANDQNFNLNRMRLAIARGADTGFGQETILNIQSLGKTLGFDIGDASKMGEQEVVLSTGNKMALLIRNPDSGMGLPGSASNKDVQFLLGSVPGLTKTKEGNLKLIDIAERSNKLKIDSAKYATRIINENGGIMPTDYEVKMLDFIGGYQMITADEKAEIEALLNPQPGSETPLSNDELLNKYLPQS